MGDDSKDSFSFSDLSRRVDFAETSSVADGGLAEVEAFLAKVAA